MESTTKISFMNQDKKQVLSFPALLAKSQEYLARRYSALLANASNADKSMLLEYIAQYLIDYDLAAEGMDHNSTVSALYREMAEYSILTPYLVRKDIEEININSWRDIAITYEDGRTEKLSEHFLSPQHATDVIKRLLYESKITFDNSRPLIKGHLNNRVRIAVAGAGVVDSDKGMSASIRIVNPRKLTRENFLERGTATDEMLSLLCTLLDYNVSMCFTGATGSGKTTLMSWILSELPNEKRIYTIEDGVREFDLVKLDSQGNVVNNVIHTKTTISEDPNKRITQEHLLDHALVSHPDVICVAEMKGDEAWSAQEAARTGHAVITTAHANSCIATYYRLATLGARKYGMDYHDVLPLVWEAFPIVAYTKKLKDNSRRIMEIAECVFDFAEQRPEIRTLWRFASTHTERVNGALKVHGEYHKLNNISEKLQQYLKENGMSDVELSNLLIEERT